MKVGDTVGGRYVIEALLGAGGMGSVWRARHLVTDKRVAIKTMLTDRDELRVRFLREARAACAVDHENVVAVHDVFEADDGTPVMVMDLLRGETFRQRLEREGRLSEEAALAILGPVVSAVAAAHASGIIHRDLKPENVFLTAAGTVKVLDFGVAKIMDESRAPSVTETGGVIGTVLYMAPEQAFGESVDPRADTWALGVMTYEALSGRRPIEGTTARAVVRALSRPEIVPLATAAPGLSASLAALCDRMLSVDPAARPDLGDVARRFAEVGSGRRIDPGRARRQDRSFAEAPTEAEGVRVVRSELEGDVGLLSTAVASTRDAPAEAAAAGIVARTEAAEGPAGDRSARCSRQLSGWPPPS